jgi:hypothetical protein
MAELTRTCVVCGEDISARNGNAIRCLACARRPSRTSSQLTVTCVACGSFYGDRIGRTGGNRRYCGTECREKWMATLPRCRFDPCEKAARSKGLCSGHAEQARLGRELKPLSRQFTKGQTCAFTGCLKKSAAVGLCDGHYEQKKRGLELVPLRSRKPTHTNSARDELGRKRCATCREWKPEGEYYRMRGKSDGLHAECKPCAKSRRRLRDFGLTPKRYDALLAAQGNACAICKTEPTGGRDLAIDHDHTCCPAKNKSCGQCIRGLLCSRCNTSIGGFRDSPELLMAAAGYLLGGHHERTMERV